jgi:hypothetical protein
MSVTGGLSNLFRGGQSVVGNQVSEKQETSGSVRQHGHESPLEFVRMIHAQSLPTRNAIGRSSLHLQLQKAQEITAKCPVATRPQVRNKEIQRQNRSC